MSVIFLGVLVVFLVHSFRTSTGPFSLCTKQTMGNQSEDKMSTSDIADYPQTGNVPFFHPMLDTHHLYPLKSTGQL